MESNKKALKLEGKFKEELERLVNEVFDKTLEKMVDDWLKSLMDFNELGNYDLSSSSLVGKITPANVV
jgi:hypothetical protein